MPIIFNKWVLCRRILYTLFFALLVSQTLFSQTPEVSDDSVVIGKITVSGYKDNAVVKKILNTLDVREGDRVEKKYLRDAFKDILDLDILDDLKMDLGDLPGTDAKELILEITPLYRIKSVNFSGNKKYTAAYLTEEVFTKIGQYFRPHLINDSIKKLTQYYALEGYLSPSIAASVSKNDATQEVSITYNIQEGYVVMVGTITIHNNEALTDEEIKKYLVSKEDKWYRKGVFDTDNLPADREAVEFAYKRYGRLDAKVTKMSYDYGWEDPQKRDKKYVNIHIWVDEGNLYYFGDFSIKGNQLFNKAELLQNVKRKKGAVFNQEVHQADVESVRNLYQDNGFIFSSITDIFNISPKKEVNYTLEIYEGLRAHIEKIFIQGNKRTKDFVIRRELLFREGEIFNRQNLIRSLQKLYNTGYFESVTPEPRAGSVEGLMNLVIKVEEKKTLLLSGGGGYGFDTGFFLRGKIENTNFLGRGMTLGTSLEAGFARQYLNLYYSDPYFLHSPFSFESSILFDVYNLELPTGVQTGYQIDPDTGTPILGVNREGNYYRISTNGRHGDSQNSIQYKDFEYTMRVASTYNFFDYYYTNMSLSYTVEKQYWDDVVKLTPTFKGVESQKQTWQKNKDKFDRVLPKRPIQSFEVGTGFTINNLDNYLFPTNGTKTSIDISFIGGDYQVMKWRFFSTYYHTLFWKVVGALEFELNTQSSLFGLPIRYNPSLYYEHTYETLKGWEPTDIIESRRLIASGSKEYRERNLLVQGNPWGASKIKLGVNFSIPLVPKLVSALLYAEMGNLYSKPLFSRDSKEVARFLFSPKYFMYSFGAGLGLQLAQFPIQFFFAWKTFYDSDQKKLVFYRQKGSAKKGYAPNFVFSIQGLF